MNTPPVENRETSKEKHHPGVEPAAEWVPIEALRPWKDNPRKNDGEPVRKVAASIRQFGFGAPLLARRSNGEIIAGHTRWKAAKELGLERVPVRFLDLNAEQAHLLALADNRLTEEATWDEELLTAVLADLQAQGQELASTGFEERELTKLLADTNESLEAPEPEISRAEELQQKWGTERGQRWRMASRTIVGGEHVLLCGDSTLECDVTRVVGDMRADCLWSDPPYGVNYVGKTKDALTIANDKLEGEQLRAWLVTAFSVATQKALKPGAAVYLAHPSGCQALEFLSAVRDVGWLHHQMLVWVKNKMALSHADYHYRHESILLAYVPGPERRGRCGQGWYGDHGQTSVFEVPRAHTNEHHPTCKPVALIEPMLRNSCPKGGCVYEPFSGSGSTLIAAESTARRCHAIEIDPRYVAVTLERLTQMGLNPQLD